MSIPMVCARDYVLRTKLGHTIGFIAGEPSLVPEDAYVEALSKNIIPFERPDTERPAFEMAQARITGTLRDALIYQTIVELVKRNDTGDFGGGMPKAAAIARETGLSVSTAEVSKYWTGYKEIMGTNAEFPSHPNVALVHELQTLTTRKQLDEFAESQGVDLSEVKGKTNKELKQNLLYVIVNQRQGPLAAVDPGEYSKPNSLTMD